MNMLRITPVMVAYALAEMMHGRIVRDAEPNWDPYAGLQLILRDEKMPQAPQQEKRSAPGAKFDPLAVATQMARDRQTVGLR